MDFDAYRNDLKTKSAVERQLQILAEAAIRLIIWDTVKKELPVLKAAVQRVLTPPANQHGPAVK